MCIRDRAGYEIVPKAPVAQKALPECNITFITGSEMKEKVSGYLQVLYDQAPDSVGGTMPDDACLLYTSPHRTSARSPARA